MKIFRDRIAAGGLLANRLKDIKADLVLGIPRGGVVVAAAVAKELNLPLDIVVTRKIGAPGQEELALGAVDRDGVVVWEERLLGELGIKIEDLREKVEIELAEIKRREELYRGKRGNLEVLGKTVILVDDGIATGATALAAINFLRRHGVRKMVVAAPVASQEAAGRITRELGEVGEMMVLETPGYFRAVGQFYHQFEVVTDEEVVQLLDGR